MERRRKGIKVHRPYHRAVTRKHNNNTRTYIKYLFEVHILELRAVLILPRISFL